MWKSKSYTMIDEGDSEIGDKWHIGISNYNAYYQI